MRIATFIISHYTFGWTQECIKDFKLHLPEQTLIGVNNNPFPNQVVLKTRNFLGKDKLWNYMCQKENKFLKENVDIYLDMPKNKKKSIRNLPYHGDVLDYIFKWSFEKYDKIMLIEPDCKINGRKWFDNMMKKNEWIVGTVKPSDSHNSYVMPICPTTWLINPVLKEMNKHGISMNKFDNDTNTGQKVMNILKNNCGWVNVKDIIHLESGSGKNQHKRTKITMI